MLDLIKRFYADLSGVTAIEYSIIAVGISIAIIGALNLVSDGVLVMFTSISNAVNP